MADSKISALTGKTTLADTDIMLGVKSPYSSDSDDFKITIADVKTSLGSTFAASAHTHTLSALAQSGASSGQVPQWNGSAWVPVAPSGGAGDVIEQLSNVTSPASPWTLGNGTGSRFQQITTSGSLTINKTTNGFTSGQLEVFILRLVASGGDIAVTWGSGISVGQGVAVSRVKSGFYRDVVLQTRDGGTTFYYDGDPRDVKVVTLRLAALLTDDQAVASPSPHAEFVVPPMLNGYTVASARIDSSAAGVTGASTYMPRRVRSGSGADLCSSNISVASGTDNATGAINSSNAGLQTGDKLQVNVVALSTTKPKGGCVTLEIVNG